MNRTTIFVLTTVLLAGSLTRADVDLAQPYRDPLSGFSIRPPKGAQRKLKTGTATLAQWLQRDEDSGAIVWTLTVSKAAYKVKEDEEFNLREYGKQLSKEMMQRDRFKVEKLSFGSVDKKPAITMAGQSAGTLKFWQKQVWVRSKPGRFLVFTLFGPLNKADRLRSVMDKVMDNVTITDPEEELKRRQTYLRNGKVALLGLTREAVAKAAADKPLWMLMKLKGKTVGWMRQSESMDKEQQFEGLKVVTHSSAELPKSPVRLSKSDMFSSIGRTYERWTELLQIGSGKTAVSFMEKAFRKDRVILCNASRNGKALPVLKREDVPAQWFLPKAIGMMLPRFLDLDKPRTYAFATYNSRTNKYDMRLFVVGETVMVEHGGRRVKAIRCQDQAHWDKEPATVYLKPDGTLIRLETADEFVVELSDEATVRRKFPKVNDVIKALDR
ncbi:MAG: hypothetical protein ACLFV7_00005 [Phycisphaerae bacterium]